MKDRLFVGVLGHRNAGKSKTWNDLFGRVVQRGKNSRKLELGEGQYIWVYLVSGSFEERQEYAGDILDDVKAQIILCSMQYTEEVYKTIQYIEEKQFELYIQWLNPGHSDSAQYPDKLGLVENLMWQGATIAVRDGKSATNTRVADLRAFLRGWAAERGLLQST